MRHVVHINADWANSVTWSPEGLDDLHRNPRDGRPLMTAPTDAVSIQIALGTSGHTWELIGTAGHSGGKIVLRDNAYEIVDTAPLDQGTLYAIRPGGISTKANVRRSETGFASCSDGMPINAVCPAIPA